MRESGERVTRQLSAQVQPQGRTVFAHKTEIPHPVICSTQERMFTVNITIIYPHKRKTKSSTYGIAQMVLDRLLSGGTLLAAFSGSLGETATPVSPSMVSGRVVATTM